MAERVAVLGLLNKRNGIVRDLTLKPGQSVRVRDVVVRLRACETTAPWESEVLTGAFVQLDVERPDKLWQRVFSGWLYKESPSLNVVEHPVYDVWPKSCAMTYPAGPSAPVAPVESSNRSSARKSGGTLEDGAPSRPSGPAPEASPVPPPAEAPPPSAAANNAT
jgi:pyruvate/2-oxoglutarate dehydrogenase complex dihydrolipoamide acyltransferase (E2) component